MNNLEKISAETRVIDVINDPRVENFGRFIFPTDSGFPNSNLKLKDVDELLPYHSHIETSTTIEVVREIFKRIDSGEKIFYPMYSESEMQKDSSKRNTGLFFFRGKSNQPFAIINAGGGFSYVGSIHESFPHAIELSRHGFNAFALKYRVGGADVACEDLARAIEFIFEHADELQVSTENYSLWGGSAGARMVAYLGSYGTQKFGQKDLPRAKVVVMQYTGHRDFTANDPATFICVGENDGIASWRVMKSRADQLENLGIPVEFHLYKNLGHGFGLGIGTSAENWIEDAILFWKSNMN